jgi:hypothetical protein
MLCCLELFWRLQFSRTFFNGDQGSAALARISGEVRGLLVLNSAHNLHGQSETYRGADLMTDISILKLESHCYTGRYTTSNLVTQSNIHTPHPPWQQ